MTNKPTPKHGNRENAILHKLCATAVLGCLAAGTAAQASTDYAPAIWRSACSGHWSTSGNGHKFLVIHDMEGYYAYEVSSSGGLRSCSTTVSVHYGVNGKKDATSDYEPGEITQFVSEANYAWHAKCWNNSSAGTEHEGFRSNPAWYTPELYQNSALLQRHMADHYGIAKDRNHIVGHDAKSSGAWVTYANANLGINANCNTHDDPGPYWDWTGFMNLINNVVQSSSPKPAVGVNSDGHLEVFAIPADGSMWQDWQTAPNGPWYAGGSGALGGNLNTAVATARNQDGRMSTFVLGNATGVFFKRQTTPGSGWDSGWSSLGGNNNTALTVVPNADGRLDAFVLGGGTAVFHQWQTAPNSSTWSGSWTSLGGNGNTALTVKANADGRLEAFVLGGGSAVFHRWQTAANSTNWNTTGWESLGGNSNTALDVIMDSDSGLNAFVMGGGTAIFHRWQTTPGGSWNSTGWESLGGNNNTAMAAIQNTDGRMEVFVLGNGSAVFHRWQTGLGGAGAWNSSGWQSLGGNDNTALAVGKDADGRLEVFVVGAGSGTRKLYRKAQVSAGSTTWESGWQDLGGNLK